MLENVRIIIPFDILEGGKGIGVDLSLVEHPL